MSAARERWLALGVLCAALLVIVVDNTIVNVALPTLAHDLDAEMRELQWVVDAYTLVFAGLLLVAGALGDRILRMMGFDPKHRFDDDLMRVKTFLETGHAPHDAAVRTAPAGQT